MNKKNFLRITGIGIVALALIFGLSTFTNEGQELRDAPNQEVQQTISISLTIESLYSNKEIGAMSGDTVLEVLRSLNEEDPELLLVTQEYAGLGILVEGMNGKTNGGNDKYWQYFVNEVMPQVGADKLELKDGDSIEWRFEKSEF